MNKEEAKQALNYQKYTEWAVIQISTDQEKHGSHCENSAGNIKIINWMFNEIWIPLWSVLSTEFEIAIR